MENGSEFLFLRFLRFRQVDHGLVPASAQMCGAGLAAT
jgi:hypothetical protein